jgi:hypothetical protein
LRRDDVGVDNVDLVLLIGVDPEIVVAVDRNAVGCVDTVVSTCALPATETDRSGFKATGISTIE